MAVYDWADPQQPRPQLWNWRCNLKGDQRAFNLLYAFYNYPKGFFYTVSMPLAVNAQQLEDAIEQQLLSLPALSFQQRRKTNPMGQQVQWMKSYLIQEALNMKVASQNRAAFKMRIRKLAFNGNIRQPQNMSASLQQCSVQSHFIKLFCRRSLSLKNTANSVFTEYAHLKIELWFLWFRLPLSLCFPCIQPDAE